MSIRQILAALAVLLSLTAAFAQPAGPGAQDDRRSAGANTNAAAGDTVRSVCDLMTREEAEMCLATKPGDASGVRSPRCDQVSSEKLQACKQESRTTIEDSASSGSSAPSAESAARGDSRN